jgi:uncharacterized protein YecE (DUF72 family)
MGTISLGTMGWSYPFWVGKLYAPKTGSKHFLEAYAQHFNTVEINNTFYRIPRISTVKQWTSQTSAEFQFAVKMPRKITHVRPLQINDYASHFFEVITHFGEKLGPILIQFPSQFSDDHMGSLQDFIHQLPQAFRYAMEFRNHTLLSDHVYTLLRDNSIALVLADRPRYPHIDCVTSTFVYVRWEGDRRIITGELGHVEQDRSQDLAKWARLLRNYQQQELNIFGYFSKFYSGYPPDDIEQLKRFLV